MQLDGNGRPGPGYAPITAGSSLHWMDWDTVLPEFRRLLQPEAMLALVENVIEPPPWSGEIGPVIAQYPMNKEFQPYDNRKLAGDLQQRLLFQLVGARQTRTIEFNQSVRAYVRSFHSRNGLSRDRLVPDRTRTFDERLTNLISAYCPSGSVTLAMHNRIIWGFPLTGNNQRQIGPDRSVA